LGTAESLPPGKWTHTYAVDLINEFLEKR